MYMKSSSNRSSRDKQAFFRDPFNVDNLRHKYLRSPYDNGYRLKTDWKQSDYWYERQLYQIQRASIQHEISLKNRINEESLKSLRESANYDRIKSSSMKNIATSGERKRQLQREAISPRKRDLRQTDYEQKYRPGNDFMTNKNSNIKLTYSFLGSPSKDPNSLNKQLEQTSNTKAAIFRRLYDEKSKKLKIKEDVQNQEIKSILKNKSSKVDMHTRQNQQIEEQSSNNDVATYLEEISFLKSQLQQKNKVIVDLQCELIRKSPKKKQRHKSDYGTVSYVFSEGEKNMMESSLKSRMKTYDFDEQVELNLSQTRDFPIRKLSFVNLDGVQVNCRKNKGNKMKICNVESFSIKQGRKKCEKEAQISKRNLQISQEFGYKIEHNQHEGERKKKNLCITQVEQVQIRSQLVCEQISSFSISHNKKMQQIQTELPQIQTVDDQTQTSLNIYDYTDDDAFWQLVFQKDFQRMQGKKHEE